ncbi:hypothetical protein R0G64_31915, partial [Pseudomonas otitidis]
LASMPTTVCQVLGMKAATRSPTPTPSARRLRCNPATWSSCSPDFGTQGVIDRFGQIEPKVLIAAAGYHYAG